MKNPLSRALGYLLEGGAGLVGLAGAGPASHELTPILFQASPGINMETAQQAVNLLFSIIVSAVTLWRMLRPKKVAVSVVPPEALPGISETVATPTPTAPAPPPLASQPLNPTKN